ncbi:MAG: 30S ribosomal protein S16 [Candidatus Azosocius agrarius]|nr:MAG: 30S ribosomal protein S16 [Gammaproteobacteria bacterium]
MVVIRLRRGGAKHRPFYYIVAADSRCFRDGAYIENLGFFNPLSSGKDVKLNVSIDRVNYWINVGAKVSDRVKFLLKK